MVSKVQRQIDGIRSVISSKKVAKIYARPAKQRRLQREIDGLYADIRQLTEQAIRARRN